MKAKISLNLKNLSEQFNKAGHNLYLVGGFVRSHFLGLQSNDVDICGNMLPQDVIELCKSIDYECKEVNKKLGTLLIIKDEEKYEYTPFRKENYTLGKHSPDSVEWTRNIEEDAKRRDFTCNAIYYDIENDEFLDFYNGIIDIENKVIKCVETPEYVFSSDGLRILRLIRFACQLGFEIDRKTLKIAKKMQYQLKYISGERITNELKLIAESKNKYGIESDVLRILNSFKIYPNIIKLPNVPSKIDVKRYAPAFDKAEDKFLALTLIILLSTTEKFCDYNQAMYEVQSLYNGVLHAGGDIKEISKVLYIIKSLPEKQNDINILLVYNALSDNYKKVVKAFCNVNELEKEIEELKQNNIPLNMNQLEISNIEIMQIVPKERISFIKQLLFDKCLQGKIKNQHDILLDVVKSLKI